MHEALQTGDFSAINWLIREWARSGGLKPPDYPEGKSNPVGRAARSLFSPVMREAVQRGDFTALNQLITQWAKTCNLDPKDYLLAPAATPDPEPGTAPSEPVPSGCPVAGGRNGAV
jgi:hypothetical protein